VNREEKAAGLMLERRAKKENSIDQNRDTKTLQPAKFQMHVRERSYRGGKE